MRTDTTSISTTTEGSAASALLSDKIDLSFVNVPSEIERRINALTVTTTPKHDVIGADSDMKTTQVCVNMKARDLPDDDTQRAPSDILVALDVSGSMTGSKLEHCKDALLMLTLVLFKEDRFGLICYDDNAVIAIPMQKMSEDNKKRCAEKIKTLRTNGSTNISAAIGLAYQELKQIQSPNAVQSVFLLTDGHANAGIFSAPDLLEFTKNCFMNDDLGTEGVEDQTRRWNPFRRHSGKKTSAKPSSVNVHPDAMNEAAPMSLHCFGFGTDHNSTLLRKMAELVSGGSYYFVDTDVNVGSAFGDALGGILSVVAQNVVVTITVPDEAKGRGVDILEVHHKNVVKRENGSYTIVVGDFYAEESRDVMFEVKLTNGTGETDQIPHVVVAVAYTDTLKKHPMTATPTLCTIARPSGSSEVSQANPHVEVQWARICATKAMKQANDMAQSNNLEGARTYLSSARLTTRRAAAGKDAAHKALLTSIDADMEELEGGLQSPSFYQSSGGHMFTTTIASNAAQRSMKSGLEGSAYTSSKKRAMARKFTLKK